MSADQGSLGNPEAFAEALRRLAETIDARAGTDPESSYTAKLLAKGTLKIAQKVSEEGGELALALVAESDEAVLGEAADLFYHVLVGLRSRGLSLAQLANILAAREGRSGLAEKASRPKP